MSPSIENIAASMGVDPVELVGEKLTVSGNFAQVVMERIKQSGGKSHLIRAKVGVADRIPRVWPDGTVTEVMKIVGGSVRLMLAEPPYGSDRRLWTMTVGRDQDVFNDPSLGND